MAKRLYRNDVSAITREKQSIAHKGKTHSDETKRLISQQLQKYWNKLGYKPNSNNDNQTATEKVYGKK